MKYVNSIYTPNLSGKQGGVIFSRNQYGPYSCQRKIPVDHRTPAQQDVRAGTKEVAKKWNALTTPQRLKWVQMSKKYPFEKDGLQHVLPGYNFFLKLNRNLQEVNQPLLIDFPSGIRISPQLFTSFSVKLINNSSGFDLLLYISPAISDKTKVKLSATMPVKDSEPFGTHKLYKIAVLDNTFVSGSSILDFYIKKYSRLPGINEQAFFSVKSTNIFSGVSSICKSAQVLGI